MLIFLLVVLAALLFILATFRVINHPKFDPVAAGLFLLTIAYLLSIYPNLFKH